ncbi:MAG TPA: hypothetical protein ENK84_00015 [Desulfobulbus sp.]|nr:hypothetical protein [Desulfobulbus sp.]
MSQEKTYRPDGETIRICGIYAENHAWNQRGRALVERLGVPRIRQLPDSGSALIVAENGLSLLVKNDRGRNMHVEVDFTTGKWRRRIASVRREQIIRAMGRNADPATTIIDATGGLGRDSFLLAAAGFQVHVVERNPLLAALLEDGLLRARESRLTRNISARISLTCGNACHFLEQQQNQAAIVYLDPLFPTRKKSARVKKELQVIREIAGSDDDPTRLFAAALKGATGRVVVKRPQHGPWLDDRPPSYSVSGKIIRFDIYLVSAKNR